jgi:hypothetical protein
MSEQDQPKAYPGDPAVTGPHHPRIRAEALMDLIAPAIGMHSGTIRRLIIDLEISNVARIYVETLGDTRLLELNPAAFGQAAIIRTTEAPNEP